MYFFVFQAFSSAVGSPIYTMRQKGLKREKKNEYPLHPRRYL